MLFFRDDGASKALVRSSLGRSETAKSGVSRGHNQRHIGRRAAGDMDDSDDIVVEENIPETLSPGSHQQHTSSPTVSPKAIDNNSKNIVEEIGSNAVEDEGMLLQRDFLGGENDSSMISDHQVRVMKSIRTPPPPSKKKQIKSNSSKEATEQKQLSPHSLSVQELIKTTQNLIGNLDIKLPKRHSGSTDNTAASKGKFFYQNVADEVAPPFLRPRSRRRCREQTCRNETYKCSNK